MFEVLIQVQPNIVGVNFCNAAECISRVQCYPEQITKLLPEDGAAGDDSDRLSRSVATSC